MQICLIQNNNRLTAGTLPIYVQPEISAENAVDTSTNYPRISVINTLVLSLENRVSELEDALAVAGYASLQAAISSILSRLAALEQG
jgi:cystathionine beta-lyase/cystathionine gamma-synthase